jgi:hypothetical protein
VNVYHKDNPENIVQMYAVIDDQSNRSLTSPEFFNLFNIKEKPKNYTLSTCSGRIVTSGKRAKGFIIESIHRHTFQLYFLDCPCDIQVGFLHMIY